MIKKKTLFPFALILTAILFTLQTQSQTKFLRYPTISKDGNTVLFTYQGDIWSVPSDGGDATRLTTNPANDTRPVWSPDGNSIAFSSDRNGNYDIFTLPLKQEPVEQLTFHSKNDIITDWTGETIRFNSSRFFAQVEREDDMLAINENGGTPHRFVDAVGFEPAASPDQKLIAFVRGSCRTSREAYRGSANRDIWVYNTESKNFFRITDFNGNDFQPQWKNNRELVFISARNGKYNLFETSLSENGKGSGEINALTDFSKNGVRYFTLAENGKIIAFEKGNTIHLWSEGKSSPIQVKIIKDFIFPDEEYKTFTKDISNYKLSPSEKQIAFIIKGNLFVKYNHKSATKARTVLSGADRIKSFDWLNDSTLVYTSDKHQQYDIFSVQPEENKSTLYEALSFKTKRLTKSNEDESDITIGPDYEKIAFVRGPGTLITATVTAEKISDENILLDSWSTPHELAWSPDGIWLAYSQRDMKGNREIFIHKADGSKKQVNISLHPRNDYSPRWSHDKLAFISERNNGDQDVWFVWLSNSDWERTRQEWQMDEFLKDSTDTTPEKIQIDFKDIYKRVTQVTGLPGNESDLQMSPDGERFYFVTNRDDRSNYKAPNEIYTVKWDGSELKPLTTGDKKPYGLRIDSKGKKLFALQSGGKLLQIDIKSKKAKPVAFKATATINYQQQNEQKFEEGWRALEQGFYDPDFHGQDWDALKKKYKPWCMAASTNNDFTYAFNLMLGQVNASHMGLRNNPKRYKSNKTTTGLLGIDITPQKNGILVKEVLNQTPANREVSRLMNGDLIKSVDGVSVDRDKNFYMLLNNKANEQVVLGVERNKQELDVVIRPTKSIRTQRYNDWVEERRKITEKLSDGRLGYIHIRGMNWSSFEAFERELAASAYDKEGLVIDVRFNGGGWTTDYLMAILDVRQHAYTIPRGATDNLEKNHEKFRNIYPFGERLPFFPWTKPSVTLCNQNSYSNAEIFSHAFKTLDIGTLVGTPTFGAVISTGGVGLVDGSYVRLPFRAWYVKATNENMEHEAAIPDVIIDNDPDSKAKGEDPQLKKSIDVILQQIDQNK